MTLFSASDIAEFTAIDQSAMNETFTITDVVYGDDGGGGQTQTATTRTTIGYLYSQTGDEIDGDQQRSLGRQRIHVPKTFAITATARITRDSDGKVYEVKYVFPLNTHPSSRMIGVSEHA